VDTFLHQIVCWYLLSVLFLQWGLWVILTQFSQIHPSYTRHCASSTQVWLLVSVIIMLWCFHRKFRISSTYASISCHFFSQTDQMLTTRFVVTHPQQSSRPSGLDLLSVCVKLVMIMLHHLKDELLWLMILDGLMFSSQNLHPFRVLIYICIYIHLLPFLFTKIYLMGLPRGLCNIEPQQSCWLAYRIKSFESMRRS
jgi:hypothetical protein